MAISPEITWQRVQSVHVMLASLFNGRQRIRDKMTVLRPGQIHFCVVWGDTQLFPNPTDIVFIFSREGSKAEVSCWHSCSFRFYQILLGPAPSSLPLSWFLDLSRYWSLNFLISWSIANFICFDITEDFNWSLNQLAHYILCDKEEGYFLLFHISQFLAIRK